MPVNTVIFRTQQPAGRHVDAAQRVQLKSITEGRDFGTEIEVLAGLDPDDTLIVNPPDSIVEGHAGARSAVAAAPGRPPAAPRSTPREAPAARSRTALLAAALDGCSLAPHYQRPAMPAPPHAYKEAGDWKAAAPADTSAPRPLVDDVRRPGPRCARSSRSPTPIRTSRRLWRASSRRARRPVSRASAWFPTVTAEADATRGETSIYSAELHARHSRGPATPSCSAGDLSYEIDLFGRIRNTVAGARATEQATAGDLAALDLALHAELATDYFTLRGLDIEQRFLDRTVADYARALELTENLYNGGAAAISDVQQAQAQLETARTQAEDTRLRRAQTEHAIAVLIGREASGFTPRALAPAKPSAQMPAGRRRRAFAAARAPPRRRGGRAARRRRQRRHRRGARRRTFRC